MKANRVVPHSSNSSVLADYLALIKSRLLLLVLISVCMGFFISFTEESAVISLLWALIGVYFVGGGANTLNQWLEKDADVLMARTQHRPLPCKRITPMQALIFGFIISAIGFIIIGLLVNSLTLLISFLSWLSYLIVYTPLKKITSLNTWIGAVPGSLPAVLGCTAASGTISEPALIIFLILYVWQMPHFFAISWVYRQDYLKGGFKMLSWNDEEGATTSKHIVIHSLLLLPVSSSLFLLGHFGLVYLFIALIISLVFIYYAIIFYKSPSKQTAKKVFYFSIIYLPILFVAIIVDKFIIYIL